MRKKSENVFSFWSNDDDQDNKTLREYRQEYKTLDEILNHRPEILDVVHRDLKKLSKATGPKGRKGVLTSENLFRTLVVMQREGLDYREASVRIGESETLQNFCRLIRKKTIDYTLLNKAFCKFRRKAGKESTTCWPWAPCRTAWFRTIKYGPTRPSPRPTFIGRPIRVCCGIRTG